VQFRLLCLFCIEYEAASAMGWPLIQNSPTGRVSNCEWSINHKTMRPKPDYGCSAKNIIHPSIK